MFIFQQPKEEEKEIRSGSLSLAEESPCGNQDWNGKKRQKNLTMNKIPMNKILSDSSDND